MRDDIFFAQIKRLEGEFKKELSQEKSRIFYSFLKDFRDDFVKIVFDDLIANSRFMPTLDDVKKSCDKARKSGGSSGDKQTGCANCGGTFWIEAIVRSTYKTNNIQYVNFRCSCAERKGMLPGVKTWNDSFLDEYILFNNYMIF